MCGILGLFSTVQSSDLEQRVHEGLRLLQHRGPNDRGQDFFFVAGGILALGHTRLSIIDLSPGGHQPKHSSDGRYTIVFNGEIYNYKELRQELQVLAHQFQTDSDTEVLLACWAQWGAKCLTRLRGMFAFAVFDHQSLTLTCVRDAFGIKPFFYRQSEDGFWFSSELSALLTLLSQKPALNVQRAYDYLVGGSYDNCDDTFFDGIHHLLPGHLLALDLEYPQKKAEPVRWWKPSISQRTDMSFADAVDQLRTMFLSNVRLHLRSDVPLGAALSGGIDSSALICAIRHVEPDMPIHTFTYAAEGSDVDESRWAAIVNSHTGSIAHKVIVRSEELAADLDDMIRAQGEPFGSTSIYAQYRVFRMAREQGITVMLDGQGADELLAGYNGYPGPRIHSMIERGELTALIRFLREWSRWPGRSIWKGLQAGIGEFVPQKLNNAAFMLVGRNPAPAWLNISALNDAGVMWKFPGKMMPEKNCPAGRRLASALRQALTGQGLNALLRHADRNSMHWSIESRVPFLTTDLAEFLLSLPEQYLSSTQGETKHIFRAAMRGIVPDSILDRKDKIGFATPESTWLKQLKHQVIQWIDGAELIHFLQAEICRKEVQAMIDSSKKVNTQVWRLIIFCRWFQIITE